MNVFKKIYCRIFQTAFRLAIPFMPYRKPEIIGELNGVSKVLKQNVKSCALVVTDGFLSKTEKLKSLIISLEQSGIRCVLFDKTNANPTVFNVEDARKIYLSEKCDCIIGYGGGSSIDCAKAVGARIAYPEKSLNKLKGTLTVRRNIPLLIAIPTTAGTGSEVTVTAVITDSEKKHKYTMNSFKLIPQYAVLDPSVTYTLPPKLTATTGMDALTHAVEAYIGNSTTKETRKCALTAVKLIFENISVAYSNGQNQIARKNMLEASYLAGVAFTTSYVGYVHAVAHSLGGQYNVAHGLANSVLLPVVLSSYGKKIHKKLYELACFAGVATSSDSVEVGANKFIDAIKKLNSSMGIPETFSEINAEDIPHMAKYASKEANPLYPVPVLMDAKQLEKFYYTVSNRS